MVNLNFIPTLNFETFKEILSRKETLMLPSEAKEFFDDFSLQIEENTNLLAKLSEEELFEKVTSILVFVPAEALMGLHLPKIVTLLLCDDKHLEELCYQFSHGTVKTQDICGDENDDLHCIILEDFEELGLYTLEGFKVITPIIE